jgi:hypothetical protein
MYRACTKHEMGQKKEDIPYVPRVAPLPLPPWLFLSTITDPTLMAGERVGIDVWSLHRT